MSLSPAERVVHARLERSQDCVASSLRISHVIATKRDLRPYGGDCWNQSQLSRRDGVIRVFGNSCRGRALEYRAIPAGDIPIVLHVDIHASAGRQRHTW